MSWFWTALAVFDTAAKVTGGVLKDVVVDSSLSDDDESDYSEQYEEVDDYCYEEDHDE